MTALLRIYKCRPTTRLLIAIYGIGVVSGSGNNTDTTYLEQSTDHNRKQELATIEARLFEALDIKKAPRKDVSKAYNTFKTAAIRPSGNGFTGAPIVAPDELNRQKGEISLMIWKICYQDLHTTPATITPPNP